MHCLSRGCRLLPETTQEGSNSKDVGRLPVTAVDTTGLASIFLWLDIPQRNEHPAVTTPCGLT